MMVPEDPASVDFSDGQEQAERQIKLLCTRLLAGWAGLQTSDMQVSRISGGISNLLVKVEPPPPLQPVAVKVFGDKTELLIDREAEKRLLLRLNAAGFGAPVVGLFDNGRVESFLTAKTLTPEEMCDPRVVTHIARRLRAFHDLRLDPGAASSGGAAGAAAAAAAAAAATAEPSPAAAAATAAASGPAPPASEEEPSQWDAIFGWLAMAERLSFPHDAAKQAAYDNVDFGAMRSELTALREVCGRVASPRVLCHNDLLSGNILVVQRTTPAAAAAAVTSSSPQQRLPPCDERHAAAKSGQNGSEGDGTASTAAGTTAGTAGEEDVLAGGDLQFIDFEYSCYGPRGFDWGNHFNEYAGFDCVYDRFPSPEQQKAFFRHYLKPGELRHLALRHLAAGSCNGAAAGSAPPPPAAARSESSQAQLPEAAAAGGAAAAGPSASEDAAAAAAEGPAAAAAALAAAEEAVLDRLVAEACVFALASHAYWGVWSFIQARYSPINFDYLDYSRMRWAEYYRRKDEFFGMVQRLFAGSM